MQRPSGIGGVFARAKDPEALYAWYAKHLGLRRNAQPQAVVLEAEAGALVLNYRVEDLDALVASLRAHGIEILGREDYDYGRFAWIADPEGNRIRLCEPAKM